MSKVLCLYYSRKGHTRRAVKQIAYALEAEIVSVTDGVDRKGWRGYVRSGMDAFRRSTRSLTPYEIAMPLEEYDLVILGTPIWCGRCSSPIRGFLKRHGLELSRVAYVVTRGSEKRYENVYDQMDQYTHEKHLFGVSLRPDSEGYGFWRDQFIHEVQVYLERWEQEKTAAPEKPTTRKRKPVVMDEKPERRRKAKTVKEMEQMLDALEAGDSAGEAVKKPRTRKPKAAASAEEPAAEVQPVIETAAIVPEATEPVVEMTASPVAEEPPAEKATAEDVPVKKPRTRKPRTDAQVPAKKIMEMMEEPLKKPRTRKPKITAETQPQQKKKPRTRKPKATEVPPQTTEDKQ